MSVVAQEREKLLGDELQRLVSVIIKEYYPEKIVLFGSLASGKIHPYSDIDLMVVKSTRKRFIDRLHEIHRLTKPAVGVNFVVYTAEEIEEMIKEGRCFLLNEILGKGKVLYEKQQLA
jgi:predicted nucleotidyltransferase